MYVQSILAAKGADVATIAPEATVRDAVALLNERKVGALGRVDRRAHGSTASSPSATSCGASARTRPPLSTSPWPTYDP